MIYISSAYTNADPLEVEKNVAKARAVAQEIIHLGALMFCPHTHSHGFLGLTHSEWLTLDLKVLNVCDAILMVNGWQKSKGATMEWQFAQLHGIPTFYSTFEVKTWLKDHHLIYNPRSL